MNAQPVLVTGAAGFIGSHVTDALLLRGDRVVGIDNFDGFYDPAIKRANISGALTSHRFTLVEGDIRDRAALRTTFEHGPFAGVIHLAARAGVRASLSDPLLYEDINVRGTSMVLEHVRGQGTGHFVHGSSSSVYGATSNVPFSEDQPADRPSSPYAATKRSNEIALYAFHHVRGTPVTCLRFFTAYGPRQRPEMAIHKFVRLIAGGGAVELYGDGSTRRDYTYIDDIVEGVLRALDRPRDYRIYNLGTTVTTPLLHLVSRIAAYLEEPLRVAHLPEQPGDVPITFADIRRAQRELGYQPGTDLETGLGRFVAWFRARGSAAPARISAA